MEKKNILITGGSKGIGSELVIELAKRGHNIIFTYLNSQKNAEEIVNRLISENLSVEAYKLDIRNYNDVLNVFNEIINKYKKIDVLINNAGISQIKPFLDTSLEDWENMMNTNLNSVFYTTRVIAENMNHYKEGLIINVSSIWGLVGSSCEVPYSTSKAGMIGFTKALAKELGLSNIRVNAIAPGFIDTEMNSKIDSDVIDGIKEEIPLGKIGKKIDIVRCVEWLVEDQYTTGQVISITGGWNIN